MADLSRYPAAIGHCVDTEFEGGGIATLFNLRGFVEECQRRPYRERPLSDVLNVQFFTPTCALRREVIVGMELFRTDFRIHEDREFLTRVALRGGFRRSEQGAAPSGQPQ